MGSDRRSQIGILFFSIMTMAFHGIVVFGFRRFSGFEKIQLVRTLHFFLALLVFIAVFFLRKNWSKTKARVLFTLLIIPLYFAGWYNHIAMVNSSEPWIPFKGFYVVVLALAMVAPAGYVINMVFLAGISTEIIILWFYLDMAHRPNFISSGEPYYIIGTSTICLLLLLSRHQDEKTIRTLAAEKAKGEMAKSLARVLLTIRDRMNTPLQNIGLLVHIFRNSAILTEQKAQPLVNSLNSIIRTNQQFNRLEDLIDWEGKNLMTDEEIEEWLNSLDAQKRNQERFH